MLDVWQGFNERQLGHFSVTQAAVITRSQYQSLDSAKQKIIREKLFAMLDDLLNNPTEGNAGTVTVTSLDYQLLFVEFNFNRKSAVDKIPCNPVDAFRMAK